MNHLFSITFGDRGGDGHGICHTTVYKSSHSAKDIEIILEEFDQKHGFNIRGFGNDDNKFSHIYYDIVVNQKLLTPIQLEYFLEENTGKNNDGTTYYTISPEFHQFIFEAIVRQANIEIEELRINDIELGGYEYYMP